MRPHLPPARPPPSRRPLDVPSRGSAAAASRSVPSRPRRPIGRCPSSLPATQGKLKEKGSFPATLQVEMRRRPLSFAQARPALSAPAPSQRLLRCKFEAGEAGGSPRRGRCAGELGARAPSGEGRGGRRGRPEAGRTAREES